MWLKVACILAALSFATIDARSARTKRSLIKIFRWRDCGSDPDRPLTVSSFSMAPMPMMVPGNVTISFSGGSNRDMGNGKLKLTIIRQGWMPIYIPCVENIGSCEYADSCQLLQAMKGWGPQAECIAHQISQIIESAGANSRQALCKFKRGYAHSGYRTLYLPPLPNLPGMSLVMEANYQIRVQMTEHVTNAEIGCIDMNMSVRPIHGRGNECPVNRENRHRKYPH
ncbi:ganglioside GM2 activator-like [Tubulanus polymorphus]|uniref:ganglioside GM2 activator-like n=1 Tax=Tubulanus polymorphus TaxID=672921 RepID=UPI003DA1EC55